MSKFTQRPEYAQNYLGHYINCKYYGQKISEDTVGVDCEKHGVRDGCEGCNTCPKCGGRLYGEPEREYDGRGCYDVYQNQACMQCGARYQGKAIKVPYKGTWGKDNIVPVSDVPDCEVEGCGKYAWEGHKFNDVDICLKHKRQMRDWKAHPGKGEDQIPLIEVDGVLKENPKYKIKTTPKNGKKKSGGSNEEKNSSEVKEVGGENAVDDREKAACPRIGYRQGTLSFSGIESD